MVDIAEVRLSNFVRLGFLISMVSALVLVVAALGYRWDLWSVFREALHFKSLKSK